MQTLPRPPASALRANAVPRSLVAAAAGVAFRYAASPRLSSARGTEVHVPSFTHLHSLPSSLNSAKWLTTFPSLAVNFVRHKRREAAVQAYPPNPSAPPSPFPFPEGESAADKAKLSQVAKRLESTSRHFKRLGTLGFWGQLVCTTVAAVILSFSTIATGKVTSPGTFYATAAGIAAAFVSVFWSFGYIRLSERLRRTANEPAKAPPRAEVVKSLQNGIVVNLLGMGAAILGMQATVGLLVAKALTTSSVPYYQGLTPGQSPVLALDVFLVQASANTTLAHFLGLVFSLELLRSVTLPQTESIPIPKPGY